jgi:hypothetical protein
VQSIWNDFIFEYLNLAHGSRWDALMIAMHDISLVGCSITFMSRIKNWGGGEIIFSLVFDACYNNYIDM